MEWLPVEGGAQVKITVETGSQEKTVISFWDNADDSGRLPKEILHKIGLDEEKFPEVFNGGPARSFPFPSGEADLYAFIAMFLERLRRYVGDGGSTPINSSQSSSITP